MQNPFAALVGSVVRWFRSNHRISAKSKLPHPSLTPEEFRRMLAETLANDPELARQMLRPLIGTVIPVVAGGPNQNYLLKFDSSDNPVATATPVFEKDGNKIGIGTTSPKERMQLGDRWTFHDGGDKVIGYNWYYDGSTERRIVADEASAIRFGSGGSILVQVAPTGAADSAITWSTQSIFVNGGNGGLDVLDAGSPRVKLETANTAQHASSTLLLKVNAADEQKEWHVFAQKDAAGAGTGTSSFQIRRRNGNQTEAVTPFMITWSSDIILQAGFQAGNQTYGNVGIGTTDRLSKLTVKGSASFQVSGVSITSGSTTVTGSGTSFTQQLGLGDRVTVSGQTRSVVRIVSDTSLIVNSAFTTTASSQTMSVLPSILRADDVNQILFLRPGGGADASDDGDMINDAIDTLPDDGGIIYLLPGTYNIKTTITNVKTGAGAYAKRAVKLRGFGGMAIDYFMSGQQTPLTSLKWDASVSGSGKRVVSFESVSSTLFSQDFEISDLTIDGSGVAEGGLYLRSISTSKFINVQIQNLPVASSIGIEVTSAAGEGTQQGSGWNLFLNCSVDKTARGVVLTNEFGSEGNASHNSFIGLSIAYYSELSANAGIWLGDCDNNLFERVWIYPRDEGETIVGYGVVVSDPKIARSNYFYHLQTPSFIVKNVNVSDPLDGKDSKNLIFGYDHDNCQAEPSATDTGGSPLSDATSVLFWINSKGQIRGQET